jgi:hypothetical protein
VVGKKNRKIGEGEIMELSDYISLTLTEIAKGVKKANKPYAKKQGITLLSLYSP